MKLLNLKYENLEQTILSTSIETVGPISDSDNNLQKSKYFLMKSCLQGGY